MRSLRGLILCVFWVFVGNIGAEKEPVVRLPSGQVKGYVDESTGGLSYYGFRAIPYAQKPARFQAPEEAKPWSGVHDATQIGVECPQYEEQTNLVIGDEDCLKINVYTPNIQNDIKLPVMVWIHGGGFTFGSGIFSSYGPQLFMDHSIVLVTFNYRLGALGFLNTEDGSAFGNYGMLDQVLALKWVQNNIRYFGGDSNMVTIFGESAGSSSIICHLLSPLSKGLFHGAIAQSGSPLNYRTYKKNPLKLAKMLAEKLQCRIDDTKLLVDCLKEVSLTDLITASRKLQMTFLFPLPWVPTVDSPHGPGFLTADPINLLTKGQIANKVPMIMGLAKTEGYVFYIDMSRTWTATGKTFFDTEFPKYLEKISAVQPNMSSAFQEIANQYYSHLDVDNKDVFLDVMSKILGDAMFSTGVSKTAELLSQHGVPVNAYLFDYIGEHCLSELYGVQCGKYCSHADEVLLQFKYAFGQLKPLNEEDSKMSQLLNGLWASFAHRKNLIVTVDEKSINWPLYGSNRNYIELNLQPKLNRGLLSDKMEFWFTTIPNLAKKLLNKLNDEL